MDDPSDAYLAREARLRITIDEQLSAAGWVVQHADKANLAAGRGRRGQAGGTTLVEVEHQSGKYVEGLPGWMKPPVYPLPFIYESTSAETRFTNGYYSDARSRRAFSFHRPETLAEWSR